ncbi:18697_t:CDS:1, partial [Racocetra persica]
EVKHIQKNLLKCPCPDQTLEEITFRKVKHIYVFRPEFKSAFMEAIHLGL